MKNNSMFNKNLAFTLAEVLLVVAIIGVTAVLTIPNLSTGIEEDKVVTKIRSTVGMLEPAIAQVALEHPNDFVSSSMYIRNAGSFCSHIVEHLKIGKNCGGNGGCFASSAPASFHDETLDNSPDQRDDNICSFILDNGVSVAFTNSQVYLDIDGPNKGENALGKDIFRGGIDENNGSITFTFGSYAVDDDSETFKIEYQTLMWILKNGNMDYLKCLDSLNWQTQTTCP